MGDRFKKVVVFMMAFLLGFSFSTKAQENVRFPEYEEFKMVVDIQGDTVKLTCLKGCAWKELSFVQPYALKGQAINEYGLTMVDHLNQLKKGDNYADFLLTIKRNSNELVISGLKGMYWKSLIINCPDKGCLEVLSEKGTQVQFRNTGY
jgi:hypothetical protein